MMIKNRFVDVKFINGCMLVKLIIVAKAAINYLCTNLFSSSLFYSTGQISSSFSAESLVLVHGTAWPGL